MLLRMGYRESARFHDMATERVSSGKKGIRTLVGSERSARTMKDARERPLECARGVAGTVGRTRRTCVRVASCAARGRRRRVVARTRNCQLAPNFFRNPFRSGRADIISVL